MINITSYLKKVFQPETRPNFWFFIGVASLFYFFVFFAVFLFSYLIQPGLRIDWVSFFSSLIRWDAGNYLNIASHGYTVVSTVWFPLYPILIKILSPFLNPALAGFFISWLSLGLALFYLYKILASRGSDLVFRTIAFLLLSPVAVFFASVYTESLFLALSLAFFYYLGQKRWLSAAILGTLAATTRNVGIFLLPIYLLGYYQAFVGPGFNLKKIFGRREFWWSLIILIGPCLYGWFCYLKFGDFLAFIHGQQNWSSTWQLAWPWATAKGLSTLIFKVLGPGDVYAFIRIVIIEFGSFLLLASAVIYWFWHKNFLWAVYGLLNLILFSCMMPMVSINRYLLVIFPVFVFLAEITKKRPVLFYFLLVLSLAFLVFNIFLFSNGAWIG